MCSSVVCFYVKMATPDLPVILLYFIFRGRLERLRESLNEASKVAVSVVNCLIKNKIWYRIRSAPKPLIIKTKKLRVDKSNDACTIP